MACLLGVQQSFQKAQVALKEVAGWDLDDDTIRRLTHATAARVSAGREGRDTAALFAAAEADGATQLELHIDAGKVNTTDGWKDAKALVVAARKPGQPTTAEAFDGQDRLPAPAARAVLAGVEHCAAFGDRVAAEVARLGLADAGGRLSVLGDGAEWIWELAGRHFPAAQQVLDLWHGCQHIWDAARGAFGAAGADTGAQAERGCGLLLSDGYSGVVEWIGQVGVALPAGGDGAALGAELNYFAGHQGRLNYALRLRRGQAIGSGLVEGAIKQLINRRLKQTGARWKVEHVAPLIELGALAVGPEWQAIWENN
jgi:hypothetical protein